MQKILIVDDAEINRELLKDIFEDEYSILEARDGQEAIDIIDLHKLSISLVFLDLVMPNKSGLDVLSFMNDRGYIDHIPVIMITGEATIESDLRTYEYGAADIIYKPFEPSIVTRRAKNLIELYQNRESIERQLEERTKELRKSQEQLAKNNEFLINALGSVVEFRSLESGEHVKRVKNISGAMLSSAKRLFPEYGLDDSKIHMITQAAALHDLGKIAIPDVILNKPGRFTPEEFAEMKMHTIYGCRILENFKQSDSEFYRYCYEICRWHHERHDGNGYPDGLVGDEIPVWAEAVAVADCFDALVSKRVYKSSFSFETAFSMIKEGKCGVFSPNIMKCFEDSSDELVRAYSDGESPY